eukprot:TRINITY_DN8801_c0_g1_i2.p1 TRINITY_DN8801_c0_g1~~TRINITY_DN8801_c0_g1_i2.p1  ORF type:complete len:1148 (-),score=306.96 TRINITY_DN8801_c0_g1_i2:362-3805(-)
MQRGHSPHGSEADDDDRPHAGGLANAGGVIGLPLKELQKLKGKFQDEDGNPKALNLEQFVDALSANQASADEAQRAQWHSELCTLFKKIDASCADAVDWEEFTNYMLLHMPGFGAGEGARELSHNPSGADAYAAGWGSGHTDMINAVTVVYDAAAAGERGANNSGGGMAGGAASGGGGGGGGGREGGAGLRRYITCGRDGFVKVWHTNLTLHRAIDVGASKKTWLEALCWMPKSRRLAVASSGFKVFFYDATFGNTPVAHIDHKESTPACLGYTHSTESDGREREILMVGDNIGWVTVYNMDDDWTDFVATSDNDPLRFKTKPTRFRYHQDWVTKVGFVSELQAMVTCSLDGEINLCDVNTNQRKTGSNSIKLHKKGVHSWCWFASYKFFASGGLDRHVIIWNPYTQKAMNYLQGHNAAVLEVLVNESQHQLISLSVDKVVKVWDMRNYRCIQTFTDKTEYKPEDRLTCIAFDEEVPALVMCSNTLNVLPVSVKVETSRTHMATIIGALYNDDFHQVVSGDNTGTICVWDVRSGKLEFEFWRTHGDHRLTCICFDESKRRLYTGSEDGVVKLWNFSSGQQLRTYTMKNPSEITKLLWAQEGPNTFLVGLTWERLFVWPDSKKQTVEVQYTLEDFSGYAHVDDISCVCHFSSGQLATGGEDGYVVFWKIQETSSSGSKSRRYRLADPGVSGSVASKDTSLRDSKGHGNVPGGAGGKALGKKVAALGKGQTVQPVGKDGKAAGAVGKAGGRPSLSGEAGMGPLGPTSGLLGSATTTFDGALPNPASLDSRDKAATDAWPQELGFDDDLSASAVAGIERMIYLEHKECLLSTHTDRIVRVWSTKRAEFLQHLQLLAPAPPPPEEKEKEGEDDNLHDVIAKKFAASTPGGGAASSSASADASKAGSRKDGAAAAAGAEDEPEERPLVNSQKAAVTALLAESASNKILFTGDSEGFVRLWGMSDFQPTLLGRPMQKHLLRSCEFQPHRQAVTQLQHFELEGVQVIMTASTDCTIALCTTEGERIGTFCSKGPHWSLGGGPAAWSSTPPLLEEGPKAEDDDGWGASPRKNNRPRAGAPGLSGGAVGAVSGRAGHAGRSRPGVGTRPTPAPAACGTGIFKQLRAVERFKPDLSIGEREKQRLGKLGPPRSDPMQ